MSRIFISYRRDDSGGYAGRLEDALEVALGREAVFRDVQDIAPGDDFVAAIRQRLKGADTVLVLIGPRWAGRLADGRRRIDDPGDFVRMEIIAALGAPLRVIPVLLAGAKMPAEADLPDALKPLARRNAFVLSDAGWHDDFVRLLASLRPPRRRGAALALAALLALAIASGAAWWWSQPAAPTLAERIVGSWQGNVRYAWGDRYDERFEFKRHAGELTGTASFLTYPRAIEALRIEGNNLHFETRSQERVGESEKTLTHRFAAEWVQDSQGERLRMRLVTTGGHSSNPPIEFEARRVAPVAADRARP
ncbi:MAG: toll/interleukin-1 receptor domain-containing protein [Moraxellaceae bacterium]|nr:toll/interleukin-1 receptor domain-containing protein [Moraxellaceae bacterium]